MGNKAKAGSAHKIELVSYEQLIGGSAENGNVSGQIVNLPISELYGFKGHPFRVEDDEKMAETAESIAEHGVLVPGIARIREGGGYEIIAGHRRKRGCELAGKTEMPFIIHNYTDDEAVVIMVDSNIQREDILPGEKAKAYAMKYEAMKHQGKKSGMTTLEKVGEAAGENAKKVQRYIWLSRLCSGLLDMVDSRRLGVSQGVDISFLPAESQKWVQDVIEELGCPVSTAQSSRIKEYAKSGELTPAVVRLILLQEKPRERRVTLKADKISRYFSDRYSSEDIESIIIGLLDEWQAKGGGAE